MKKVICLILAAMMVLFVLTSCGKPDEPKKETLENATINIEGCPSFTLKGKYEKAVTLNEDETTTTVYTPVSGNDGPTYTVYQGGKLTNQKLEDYAKSIAFEKQSYVEMTTVGCPDNEYGYFTYFEEHDGVPYIYTSKVCETPNGYVIIDTKTTAVYVNLSTSGYKFAILPGSSSVTNDESPVDGYYWDNGVLFQIFTYKEALSDKYNSLDTMVDVTIAEIDADEDAEIIHCGTVDGKFKYAVFNYTLIVNGRKYIYVTYGIFVDNCFYYVEMMNELPYQEAMCTAIIQSLQPVK